MTCSKPNLLFFFFLNFPLIFFVLSTFFLPSSHGALHLHAKEDSNVSVYDERMQHGMVEWKINNNNKRRNAAETTNNSSVLVLAAERTHRKNPINGFQYYTGGWNITNTNYLASVAYSAIVPFVLAGIWILVFGIILLVVCFCRCCCTKNRYGYSRFTYVISILLLLVFTLASIVGVLGMYKGEKEFHSCIIDTVSYLLNEANRIVLSLQDLLSLLRAAQDVGVGPLKLPDVWKKEINDKADLIESVADQFRNVTSKQKTQITSYTQPLRIILFCIAIAMLVVAISGLLFSILGMQCLVYCLGILGWLLVAVALILAGIFLLVHNGVKDTRVAVDEWLVNPTANSAIENIIPKVDNQTATNIYHVTKGVTYSLILGVNKVITNVSNADFPPDVGPPVYYNQSGPLVPLYCNTYDGNLDVAKCKENEVNFNNVSEVWKGYVCQVSSSGICTTQGRLTPDQFTQLTASVNISHALQKGMSFAMELIDTSYLQKILGVLSENYCIKLESYTKMLYIALFVTSFGVMFSIIFWFVYANQRRHRAYTLKMDKKVKRGLFGH